RSSDLVEGPGFAVGLLADGVEEAAGMAPLALDDRLRGARDAYQAGVRDMSISVAVNDDIAGPRLGHDAIVVVGQDGIDRLVADPEMAIGKDPAMAVVRRIRRAGADDGLRVRSNEALFGQGEPVSGQFVGRAREQRQRLAAV